LDRLDIKLLGELSRRTSGVTFQPLVKRGYKRIADNLGLDEDTIRKRVERLRACGLMRGWKILINPSLLGLTTYTIQLSVGPGSTPDEAIRKIKLVPGVFSIIREVGDVLRVSLLCEDEESFKNRLGLVSELVGARDVTTLSNGNPEADVELTKTDWQLIDRLKLRPSLNYRELAEDSGLSTKTVRRRLIRLTQGKALGFVPDIDLRLLEGAACVDLFVYYTNSGLKATIDGSIFTKFEEYVLRAGWGSRSHGHFMFIVPRVTIAQEILDWARAQQGVREARLSFIYEWILLHDQAWSELERARKLTTE